MVEYGLDRLRTSDQYAQLTETQSLREEGNRELQTACIVVVKATDMATMSDADSSHHGQVWQRLDCLGSLVYAILAFHESFKVFLAKAPLPLGTQPQAGQSPLVGPAAQ